MPVTTVDFVLPWTQATATNLQTVFDTGWTADATTDIVVYARASGADADDSTDLIDAADYTVTFFDDENYVRVTFGVGRTTGDIVTIIRATPPERMNLYTNNNFNPTMLNGDFNRLVMMSQQRLLDSAVMPPSPGVSRQLSPKYNNSETLTYPNDIIYPVLGAAQGWRKNAGDTAIEVIDMPDYILGSVTGAFTVDNALTKVDTSGSQNNLQETGIIVDDSNNVSGMGSLAMGGSLSGVTTLAMSGALTIGGALTGVTSLTMSGVLSGVTSLSMGGALTGVTSLSMGGALSGVTTLSMGGALSGVTSLSMGGTLTGVTDLTASGTLTASGLIYPTSDGSANQVLTTDGAGNLTFGNGADGDVDGPASSTDNAFARYDSTTGKLLQDSQTTEDDSGNVVFAGNVTLNNDPTSALQAVTKQYADALAVVDVKESVFAASTAALTVTYDNGTLGVGATLTNADTMAAFSLDGLSPSATDRVLIKDQASGFQNGIYTVTTVGDGSTNWVLTRATDNDTAAEMLPGTLSIVENGGTENSLTSWLQTSTVTTVGTDSVTYAQFNYGTNFPSITVAGTIDLTHTATESDDHAFDVSCNAAGFGDVRAVQLGYTTGTISVGQDEAVILSNIDQSLATGGDIIGHEILATEGSATISGMGVGILVDPIVQLSGSFGDMDSALVNSTDRLAEFISAGSDIALFVSNSDTVTIGNAAKFEEIEFLLDTVASGAGVKPTFEFSTGVGTWTSFTPTDGTDGFRQNGIIAWLDGDIPTWAPGLASEYLIKITRTQGGLSTVPIEDLVQIAVATEYSWNKDGELDVKGATIADLTASRAMVTDGSKVLTSSATTSTELGYVNGVTSAIQTQIDGKAANAGLSAASRAVVTDGSSLLGVATTTSTEIGYVNGVTSAIQTQLDTKVQQTGAQIFAADAEASDTYVITLSPVPSSYTTGMVVNFSANTANTGACTINVNSLGAKSIKKLYNVDPEDGDIAAGQLVTLIYDGTNFQMQSQVANAAGGGGAGSSVQHVYTSTSTAFSTSTTVPYDTSVPTNTEGAEFMTRSITPTNASNILVIDFFCPLFDCTAAYFLATSLYQDSTSAALMSLSNTTTGGTYVNNYSLRHIMVAGTTSSTTFKIRMGASTSSVYMLQNNVSRDIYGSAPKAYLSVTEYAV